MKIVELQDEDADVLKSILESPAINVPLAIGTIPAVGASLYRIRAAFDAPKAPPKKSPRAKGIIPPGV